MGDIFDDYPLEAGWDCDSDGFLFQRSVCEACAREEHWNCSMVDWCTCDDARDGDRFDAGGD